MLADIDGSCAIRKRWFLARQRATAHAPYFIAEETCDITSQHDCNANVELVRSGKHLTFKVKRPIRAGEVRALLVR